MAHEFKLVRRVEFSETDAAGIVHYSNFFRYMEVAEAAFFRSLGLSILAKSLEPKKLGWPRVHAECDYQYPLRFEDEFEIQLLVRQKKSKAVHYEFRFRKLGGPEPRPVARGQLTVVCVTVKRGVMKATRIPKAIADRIQVAPHALLNERF